MRRQAEVETRRKVNLASVEPRVKAEPRAEEKEEGDEEGEEGEEGEKVFLDESSSNSEDSTDDSSESSSESDGPPRPNRKAKGSKQSKSPINPPMKLLPIKSTKIESKSEKVKRVIKAAKLLNGDDWLNKVIQIVNGSSGFSYGDPHQWRTGGPESTGTAFYVSEHCLLTCYHVVDDAAELKIMFEGSPITATAVSINPLLDLALVYTERPGVPMPISPELEYLNNGDDVTGHGFPLGHPNLKQTKGTVSGLWGYMCQTSVPSNPGSSGGPLVSLKTGNVVAVTASGIPSASAVAFGVPAFYVRQHIACTIMELGGKKDRIESNWTKGYDYKQLDALARKFVNAPVKGDRKHALLVKVPAFDIMFQQASLADLKARKVKGYTSGVIVGTTIPGGAFDKAGIKSGDVLLAVDDSPIDSHGVLETKNSQITIELPKLRLDYYIKQHLPGDEIKLTYNPLGEKGRVKTAKCVLVSNQAFATRPKFWLAETVDYEIFGGCIVIDLTVSVMESLGMSLNSGSDTIKALQFSSFNTPNLVVVNVLAGSYVKCKRAIIVGDIITSINGLPVNSLATYRDAIKAGIRQKVECFEIVTATPKFVTVETNTIIDQEPRLAMQNNYQPGKLHKELVAAMRNVQRPRTAVEDCARP